MTAVGHLPIWRSCDQNVQQDLVLSQTYSVQFSAKEHVLSLGLGELHHRQLYRHELESKCEKFRWRKQDVKLILAFVRIAHKTT